MGLKKLIICEVDKGLKTSKNAGDIPRRSLSKELPQGYSEASSDGSESDFSKSFGFGIYKVYWSDLDSEKQVRMPYWGFFTSQTNKKSIETPATGV